MALIQVKLFLQTFYDREFPIAEVENGMLIAWPFAQIILEPEASRQRYERNPQSFLPETVLFLAAALKAPGMAAIQEALRVVGGGEKCRA